MYGYPRTRGLLTSSQSARVDHATILARTREVNDHVNTVRQAVVSLEAAVSDPVLRKPLDPTKGMPLIIDDALRGTIEIPLNLVHSWEVGRLFCPALSSTKDRQQMFHVILAHQFENRRGHQKVVQQQYALEEARTERDISWSLPWTVSMRRGMRIHMSIVFEDLSVSTTSCPGCQTEHDVPQDVNFQWSVMESTPDQPSKYDIPSVDTAYSTNRGCKMWFRMRESDAPDPVATGSGNPTSSAAPRLNRKDGKSTTGDDTPSDFHRVRLLFPTALKAHKNAVQSTSGRRAVLDAVITRTTCPSERSSIGCEFIDFDHSMRRCCQCGLITKDTSTIETNCPICFHRPSILCSGKAPPS